MWNLRIWKIKDSYVRRLHEIDPRVQYNKGQRRPYVGIVLELGSVKYYAPMESPKKNHVNLKNSGPILKIDGGKLGLIGFNNMIPVQEKHLVAMDIDAEENAKYRVLLTKQIVWCNKNKETIYHRAQMVYKSACIDKADFYLRVCCDFKKLEEACKKL